MHEFICDQATLVFVLPHGIICDQASYFFVFTLDDRGSTCRHVTICTEELNFARLHKFS